MSLGRAGVIVSFALLATAIVASGAWGLLSGYVPQYLHESGRLDRSIPVPDLMKRAHVNRRTQDAVGTSDFSRRIRTAQVANAVGQQQE